MPGLFEHEEIPLPLLRRAVPREPAETVDRAHGFAGLPPTGDRLRPWSAGAITGFAGGAAALGVVQGLTPAVFEPHIASASAVWGVTAPTALAIAYATAAASGAMVGGAFAVVTRHLRRLGPLVVWSLVFFGCATTLALAAARTYGAGPSDAAMPSLFAATAAFALLAALELPLRRR